MLDSCPLMNFCPVNPKHLSSIKQIASATDSVCRLPRSRTQPETTRSTHYESSTTGPRLGKNKRSIEGFVPYVVVAAAAALLRRAGRGGSSPCQRMVKRRRKREAATRRPRPWVLARGGAPRRGGRPGSSPSVAARW